MLRKTCKNCSCEFIAEGRRIKMEICEACEDYDPEAFKKETPNRKWIPPSDGFSPPKQWKPSND